MWMSLGSLLVGIVATVLVSSHYYRRTLGKSLTPYIQFSSSPLRGVDSSVRKELEIRYQQKIVENLYEIQFLIANTGDKAIHDVIEPLSLKIPEGSSLLDATILHIQPQGRNVRLTKNLDGKKIVLEFPLLNSGEYFFVKILLNGSPKRADFEFTISADELPPILSPVLLPYDALSSAGGKRFDLPPFVAGLALFILGSGVAMSVYDSWSVTLWNAFRSNIFVLGWHGVALAASAAVSLLLLILGTMFSVMSFTGGRFPPSRSRFVLPKELGFLDRYRNQPPHLAHGFDEDRPE